MKKIILLAFFSLLFLLSSCASFKAPIIDESKLETSASYIRAFNVLSGGGTGALDKVVSTNLNDLDLALVLSEVDSGSFFYIYDSSATDNPCTSPRCVAPDDVDGTSNPGRWVLLDPYTFDSSLYSCDALTGGAAGALDAIDGDDLSDGYMAFVNVSGDVYFYMLDASSGASEDGVLVIAPDTNPGTKRWLKLATIAMSNGDVYVTGNIYIDGSGYIESKDNPHYKLSSTTGDHIWLGKVDADGTLEIRTDYNVNTEVFIKFLQEDTMESASNETTNIYLLSKDVYGNISIQNVTLGVDDSGGSGYKVLRVPNTN